MLRLVIVVLILVLIVSALFLPRFRRSLLATLVLVTSVIAVIIWLDNRERALQHSRLPLSQIELRNMQVTPGFNVRSHVVKGRIHNDSRDFTINTVELQLDLKDCLSENCEIVGQEVTRIFLQIPPRQSRDFETTVFFSSAVDLEGSPKWTFAVVGVKTQN